MTMSTDAFSQTGYEMYRLQVALSGTRTNVYAIFGEPNKVLQVPPAFQVAAPFGTQVGGPNPQMFVFNPDVQYDSWLTVGTEDDTTDHALSSVGLELDQWTLESGISDNDGAIFYMDVLHASTTNPVLLAQLTVPSGADRQVTMGAQGRAAGAEPDWQAFFTFTI